MQVVSVSKLEALIKEYQSEGIPTKDLEEQLRRLKAHPLQLHIPSHKVRVKKHDDGSRTITYSTGPIDPKVEKTPKRPT